ncbi:MAG: TetR/AcrR family transcriptional regulator [Bacilli bacterium]|jgi:AcrR family transcriptional regulator|nr:TetR/AcrR family transcriptional regulator [Bacilli bacterium]
MNIRDNIIEATVVLFNRKGFDFKMDDLAKELHISKKTIYKYFSTKEDIFRVFILESFQSVHDKQLEIFSNPSLSVQQKLIQILNTRSKYEDQLSIEKTLALKEYYPSLYELIMSTYQTQWENVDSLLTQGKKENIFYSNISNQVIIAMLIESMQMMHRDNLLQKTGLSYRDAISQAIEIVLNGITK